MNGGVAGIYAVYLILVGLHGNAGKLYGDVKEDGRGYMSWVLALVILKVLYSQARLRPIILPFLLLAGLAFTLKNYGRIAKQVNSALGTNLAIPNIKG